MGIKNYQHIQNLSETPNAIVSIVKNINTNKKYVMKKVVSNDLSSFREIQILQKIKLNSKKYNCIEFIETFYDIKYVYIIEEYAQNGDLLDWILNCQKNKNNNYQLKKSLEYLQQIIKGLSFLHQNNISHSDLSLENIGLTESNEIKLMDFGLSTLNISKSSQTIGKAFYAAPEIREYDKENPNTLYDPYKADIWSLGICFFMLITGSPLIGEATDKDDNYQILKNLD